jgi:hypothetical protein
MELCISADSRTPFSASHPSATAASRVVPSNDASAALAILHAHDLAEDLLIK